MRDHILSVCDLCQTGIVKETFNGPMMCMECCEVDPPRTEMTEEEYRDREAAMRLAQQLEKSIQHFNKKGSQLVWLPHVQYALRKIKQGQGA